MLHNLVLLLLLITTTTSAFVLRPSLYSRTPMSLGVWNKIDLGGKVQNGEGAKGKEEER